MKDPCGCEESNTLLENSDVSIQQVVPCTRTFHENVCVQANVVITPVVTPGRTISRCIGDPRIGPCPGTPRRNCTFSVHQNICVEVPITFAANAVATPGGIVCGRPRPDGCVPATFECCEFIMATQGTTADGTRLPSLSIQLCGPANQCSPQGNHINVQFPANSPNFEINLTEMLTMECNTPERGLITVTAQAIFNTGAGMSELANFTFIFNSNNNTVRIIATSVANGNTLLDTTITLTGNVQFVPCTPSLE
jgi:hypothetical protein